MKSPISLVLVVCTALTGCAGSSIKQADGKTKPDKEWRVSQLAKTDIDEVAETHLEESLATLKLVMEKLYRRNPRELRKGGFGSIDEATKRAFDYAQLWRFAELGEKRGVDALQLAFKPEYTGDRVFAFTVGLGSMIHLGYNEKNEFYAFDSLDAQALYNAARNIETAVWKLSNTRDAKGDLLLLSSEIGPDTRNLSFEREFGKLIAYQDVMAKIMAQRSNRTIRLVVQNIAGAVFLPVR
ncbi:MAG TPA: hypothetical protein VJU83_01335 [Burkholderiales bacterium]|nr:hypothetical protein [Burkholderiales bacterium]